MKDKNWLDMVKKQGELRHLGSLAVKKAQKGNQASAQEIDFLFRAAFAEKLMTPGQIAKAMGTSKTIISRLIEQLERKSFIVKERDENDKRSYVIKVTNSGKKEIDMMYYYYMDPLYILKHEMGRERFEQLFKLIEEANSILSGKEKSIDRDMFVKR